MSNAIGFIVNSVVEGRSGRVHAIGRCGDAPIRLGDVFEVLHPAPQAADADVGDLCGGTAVHLQVERIQAYRRTLQELGSGMTGTIDLCGRGSELVESGCVLGAGVSPVRTAEQSAGNRVGSD